MAWPLKPTTELTHNDYTIAWICALPIEKTAARNMLDELHVTPPQPEHDKNIYTFGRICGHNVVIVCQGDMGTTAASIVATRMDSTFRRLRFGLLVGIAGGVPDEKDIRLGDVVVSKGDGRSGGVVAHDRGKVTLTGFESRPFLNGMPEVVRNALSELESRLMDQDSKITTYLSQATARNSRFSAFERPTSLVDNLFQGDYAHINPKDKICTECKKDYLVFKNAAERAKILAAHPGVLAIEMEAAGLMDIFGCATIRGICDYADSHKNDGWHKYASASAAAIAKEILEIIPEPRVLAAPSTAVAGTPASHFLVPFPRNERFVGRDSQLDELATKLSSDQFCQRIAITGLGGVGKTQLALELAYRTREKCPECSIFWMPATNVESLQQAYLDIGHQLRILGLDEEQTDVKKLVQRHLSQESAGQWLLILDNADDIDMWTNKAGNNDKSSGLKDYLPSSNQGCLIFTTRSRKIAVKLAQENVMEVSEMGEDMATQLLGKSLIDQTLLQHHQDTAMLLNQLTFLPLAIVQAAAYINENGITLSDYLSLLKDQEQYVIDLLSEDFEDERRYRGVKNPVATTWLISFERIRRGDPLAADYLSFMSCIDPKEIPQPLLPLAPSRKRYVDAIGTLSAYSFITKRQSDQSLNLHRLVHLATRNWLREQDLLVAWTQKAVERLAKVFPDHDHKNMPLWRAYLPHARFLLTSSLIPKHYEERLVLLDKSGLCLLIDGRYTEAEEQLVQVMQMRMEMLGEEHPKTLTSANILALALLFQGKHKEAEALFRRALDGRKRVLGEKHPDMLTSINNLARVLRAQAKYKEAEMLFRQALDKREGILGKKHPKTLASINNLALVLWDQAKYEEAEALLRRALDGKEKVLGKEHLYTLLSASNLALVLRGQAKHEEAEALLRRVLDKGEKILGKDHPDTLTSVGNLARVLRDQGKCEEAEALLRRALDGKEKILGGKRRSTLKSVKSLVLVLRDQGKL